MRIVVTGGSGDLGARVVRRLGEEGHEVIAASRRTGVDVVTGAGLPEVMAGTDAVVFCATNPVKGRAVEVEGTRRVIEAARAVGTTPHLVGISIVGCDRTPYAYYKVKVELERLLEHSGLPATVLRATQFHALAAFIAGLRLGPIGLRIGDMALQPVDIEFVAERLAALATGPAPDGFARATDVAGPEVLEPADIAALVAAHDHRRPTRLFRIPPIGRALRAFSERRIVPDGPVEIGGASFDEWLAAQPRPLPRGLHHVS